MGLLLSAANPPAASPHGSLAPSDWVRRWTPLLPAGSTVLDVACGSGRHMAWLAAHGHRVCGVDRSAEALESARPHGEVVQADIENGPWPLLEASGQPRRFGALVVTNYLWRPLWPTLLASLTPGGVLLYETFAAGNEAVGKPSRPDFLLQRGELLRLCQGLRVVAFEDGFLDGPARFVQRVVAVSPALPDGHGGAQERYPL